MIMNDTPCLPGIRLMLKKLRVVKFNDMFVIVFRDGYYYIETRFVK